MYVLIAALVVMVGLFFVASHQIHQAETHEKICASHNGHMVHLYRDSLCLTRDGRVLYGWSD